MITYTRTRKLERRFAAELEEKLPSRWEMRWALLRALLTTPVGRLPRLVGLVGLVVMALVLPAGAQTPTTAVDDATNTTVKYGDLVNKAIRVNVVAGGGAGGTSSNFFAAFPATGTAAGARANAAAPAWGEGEMSPFSVDLGGLLRVRCDSGCGGASTFADNSAFTFGTTPVNISAGVFDDVAPNAVTENRAAAPRISGNRMWLFQLGDGAGNERRAGVTAGNALQVDGSAVTQPVSGPLTDAQLRATPVPVSGTVTVTDGAGALNTIVDSGTLTCNAGTDLNTSLLLTTTAHDAAFGVAGTADAQVRSIQGIAGMTAVTVTATNLDVQIGGSDTLTVGNVATIGTSVTPGTAAANLGKAEDAAAASADTGVAPLLVREDTPTSTAGANGDYIAAKANLWGHQFVNSMCQDPNLVTSAVISTATSGNVEIVALTSNQTIYVCSYDVMATGTVQFQWIYGTGTACATGETNLTGAYPLIAQVGLAPDAGGGILFKTAVSNALCIELNAAVQVDGRVSYVKF